MSGLAAGRYRIVESIGGGGTALVYRAETELGRYVAVKQLRPQFAADPVLRRRFLREAELARRLDHPGILQLLDAGEETGVPFVVTELALGETLRQRLDRDRKLSLDVARSIFTELARALDHAHGRGIIHRDVKPENVFITKAGVKLGDFGNARVVSLASVTGASLSWGTPEYVAPEVFIRGRADPRSDLYSLGAVLHEMLTGRLPWSRSETLTRLAGGAAVSLSLAPTGHGPVADRLIADLLAFSPAGRPASGEEAVMRFSPFDAGALAPKATTCSGCGALRPDDLPRCLSCGQPVSSLGHDPVQDWRLVLRRLEDDAAVIEKLLRLLDVLAEPLDQAPLFLTGDPALYSQEELTAGVRLPAVLFSELGEATARSLQTLFRDQGLDVVAVEGSPAPLVGWRGKPNERRIFFRHKVVFSVVAGLFAAYISSQVPIAFAAGGSIFAGFGLQYLLERRRRMRREFGLLRLRPPLTPMPAAESLLAAAAVAVGKVRAPDVGRLFADVSIELYRLTQRAEMLAATSPSPSSELDLLRRLTAAGPALLERLRRMAARLEDLDRALDGQPEGELMHTMARLERATTASGADHAALDVTRRDLEAALESRHATEQERARLSAKLCQLLGRLRLVYHQALAMETLAEQEARELEAASAELDTLLAAQPV